MKTLIDNIAWAKAEKRVFLKHSLETRLVGMSVFFMLIQLGNLTFLTDNSSLNNSNPHLSSSILSSPNSNVSTTK